MSATFVKPGWQRRLAIYSTAIALFSAVATLFQARYWVGLDLQQWKCLPWTVYVVNKSPAMELERGHYYQVATRGLAPFFEDGTRFAKELVGLPGDHVRVVRGHVEVNGVRRGWLNPRIVAKLGKTYADFDRDGVLGPGEYWMMGTEWSSFDSRYWGPAARDQIRGEAHPVW